MSSSLTPGLGSGAFPATPPGPPEAGHGECARRAAGAPAAWSTSGGGSGRPPQAASDAGSDFCMPTALSRSGQERGPPRGRWSLPVAEVVGDRFNPPPQFHQLLAQIAPAAQRRPEARARRHGRGRSNPGGPWGRALEAHRSGAMGVRRIHDLSVTKQILSRELRALGYRKLSARPRHHAHERRLSSPLKKVPALLADIAAASGKPLELWFQDEARIGQKNKITRRWAERGTRPFALKDQRTASAYIFGAIVPRSATRPVSSSRRATPRP